jgi:transposase
MDKLLSIQETSKILGVSEGTLRRWEREGKFYPDERTKGNQRRYKLSSIKQIDTPVKRDFSDNTIINSVVDLIIQLGIKEEVMKRLENVST